VAMAKPFHTTGAERLTFHGVHMDLVAAVTSEQFGSLPEEVQAGYVEKDGLYVLNVKPASLKVGDQMKHFALEDIGGLRNTLNKLKSTEKEYRTRLDSYKLEGEEYLDPEEAKGAIAKLKELGDTLPEGDVKKQVEQRIEAFRITVENKHKNDIAMREKAIQERNERIAMREGQLKKLLVDNAATQAIMAAKGNVDLLLPHVKNRTRCVDNPETGDYSLEVLDQTGQPMYSPSGGNAATLAELVDEFRNSNTFAVAFESSQSKGSGAGGSQGGQRLFTLSREAAKNPAQYRAAKELAAKAGQQVVILE
jgi:hypothetical protein